MDGELLHGSPLSIGRNRRGRGGGGMSHWELSIQKGRRISC